MKRSVFDPSSYQVAFLDPMDEGRIEIDSVEQSAAKASPRLLPSGGVVEWIRMINANVVKGVHELLEEHGIKPKPDEAFGDTVARALGISGRQSEILLESLHDGGSVDEAVAAAEIDTSDINNELLIHIGRAIGTALGHIKRG